jgi:hypothetical protein
MPSSMPNNSISSSSSSLSQQRNNNDELYPYSIGNFDVLLEAEDTSVLRLAESGGCAPHVGNNRFKVLVSMHKTCYEAALTNNNHTNGGTTTTAIVNRIIDIVCDQVKPKGQFLLSTSTGWTLLAPEQVVDFVRCQLDQELLYATSLSASLQPQVSVTLGNNNSAYFEDIDDSALVAMWNNSAPLPVHNEDTSNSRHQQNDDPKKRRRRSSLLRRSVSESGLTSSGSVPADDRKKSVRRQHSVLSVGSSGDSSSGNTTNTDPNMVASAALLAAAALQDEEDNLTRATTTRPQQEQQQRGLGRSDSFEDRRNYTTTAEALDVVFVAPATSSTTDSSRNVLVLDHTGNNRLFVLMDMQLERFVNDTDHDRDARRAVANSLLDTVRHWGGRFVQETDDWQYRLLADEDAVDLLVRALDQHSVTKVGSTITTKDGDSGGDDETTLSRSSTSTDRKHAPLRDDSRASLMGNSSSSVDGGNDSSGDDKRKIALESLQRRKKQQGLKSRLRQFANRTALTRSISEPSRVTDYAATEERVISVSESSIRRFSLPRLRIAGSGSDTADTSNRRYSFPRALQGRLTRGGSEPSPHGRSMMRPSLAGVPELSEGQFADLLGSSDVETTSIGEDTGRDPSFYPTPTSSLDISPLLSAWSEFPPQDIVEGSGDESSEVESRPPHTKSKDTSADAK